jgi:hypothetical protein
VRSSYRCAPKRARARVLTWSGGDHDKRQRSVERWSVIETAGCWVNKPRRWVMVGDRRAANWSWLQGNFASAGGSMNCGTGWRIMLAGRVTGRCIQQKCRAEITHGYMVKLNCIQIIQEWSCWFKPCTSLLYMVQLGSWPSLRVPGSVAVAGEQGQDLAIGYYRRLLPQGPIYKHNTYLVSWLLLCY